MCVTPPAFLQLTQLTAPSQQRSGGRGVLVGRGLISPLGGLARRVGVASSWFGPKILMKHLQG